MSDVELRPAVRRFAEAMELCLRRHDVAKGDWVGEECVTLRMLWEDEVSELSWTAYASLDQASEAIDVACCSMFLYDKVMGGLGHRGQG